MKNQDNLNLYGKGQSAVASAEVSHVAIIRDLKSSILINGSRSMGKHS